MPLTKTFTVNGGHVTVIGCYLHDLATVGSYGEAALWYGNVIYHIGWDADDRGHGHGIYIQNSGLPCTFKRNIIHNCYGWGIHAYTQGGHIDYIILIENICYNAGVPAASGANNILVGGYTTAIDPYLEGNNTYNSGGGVNIGYAVEGGATGVVLINNYFPDGITKVNATITTETGNTYTAPASGQRVVIYGNEYAAGRGEVAIYNWDNADFATLYVGDVLAPGANYVLRNAQNPFFDYVAGVVAQDGTILVDMRAASHSVASIVAGTAEAPTFPTFGSFVFSSP